MKKWLGSRWFVRLWAGVLVLAFVFPPEAFARMSCATLSALSVPMRCCAMRSAAKKTETRPCCLATAASRATKAEHAAAKSASRAGLDAPKCCCSKNESGDTIAPAPTASVHLDVQAWLAERAQISARAFAFDHLILRASSARDGPTCAPPPDAAEQSSPAAGCARHDLLARGVVGLLTDFGIALL
jgi:hypothetical protein